MPAKTNAKARIQVLLAMLQDYAPTAKAFEIVVEDHKNLQFAGETEETQIKFLVGALHDGLSFGNWPWTKLSEYWWN